MTIQISDDFDAGAIEFLRIDGVDHIALNIRQDSHADVTQWFYFRVQGTSRRLLRLRLMNAGSASFTEGWADYQAVASYDRSNWFRVPTDFDGEVLTISHTPDFDNVYYAYFEPYSSDRHLQLIDRARLSSLVRVENLGHTIEGRDMDLLVMGDPAARHKVWIIARQHPGETMAEWFVEGLVDALLDQANPVARQLLKHTVFYVVPNMNPDGSAHGNLRTNAAGANLNREWAQPTLDRSPEVYFVKLKMQAVGCDLFLDIHGDEGLPYVFMVGADSLEHFTAGQKAEQDRFIAAFQIANPDVQNEFGYASAPFTPATLTMATPQIAHGFGCLALTLEMPFKDNANDPDPVAGWSGRRSGALGRSILQPILHTLNSQAKRRQTKHQKIIAAPIWMRLLTRWRDALNW